MKTTLNQETLLIAAIVAFYYRCKLQKAHKVIIRLMSEKSTFVPISRKLMPTLMTMLLLLTACVNKVPGEDGVPPFVADEPNSSLSIVTRAGEEDAVISYPIHLYVFSGGKCVDKNTLSSGTDELLFKLPAGSYTVYALAGATDTDYNLPTAETAQPESIISLKTGKSHADLMTCKANIKLVEDDEHSLTITLERKVMMLNSVTITNMPTDITAVTLGINPTHESICLDGSHPTEASATHTVDLMKFPNNTTWTASADKSYFLPGGTKATITLTTTDAQSSKKNYSFGSDNVLTTNYKLNINADYTTDGKIAISGSVAGASWTGATDIHFGIDKDGNTVEGTGTGNATDKMPQPGDIYRGCYVLTTTPTTLTLLAPKEVTGIDKNDAVALAAAIAACAAATALTGWRLPTEAEARTLFDACRGNSAAMNTALATVDGDALASTKPYFCTATESTIKAFKIKGTSFFADTFVSTATVRPVSATNASLNN